jgi:hypothetical protein
MDEREDVPTVRTVDGRRWLRECRRLTLYLTRLELEVKVMTMIGLEVEMVMTMILIRFSLFFCVDLSFSRCIII